MMTTACFYGTIQYSSCIHDYCCLSISKIVTSIIIIIIISALILQTHNLNMVNAYQVILSQQRQRLVSQRQHNRHRRSQLHQLIRYSTTTGDDYHHLLQSQQRQSPSLYLPLLPSTSPPNDQHNQRPITTVMAPMVSASDYAFRCLVRQYCIQEQQMQQQQEQLDVEQQYQLPLTFTQMLHAHNYVRDNTFVQNHFDIYECYHKNTPSNELTESQRNALYNPNKSIQEDRSILQPPCSISTHGPVIAQLAGSDVPTVVKAAQQIIQTTNGQITGFDLNLGCPQNIARKGNYGAYLMENHPTLACNILRTLRQTLPKTISVSAKIRLPYHPSEQVQRLQQLCDTGIDFITIHGRDYTENKTTVKHIQVQRVIDAIQTISLYRSNLPIILNGGIEFAMDAIQLQQTTGGGASAFMSSEALLERPNLLSEIQSLQQSTTSMTRTTTAKERFNQQIQFAKDYIQWCYYSPPLSFGMGNKGGTFNVIRGHLFKILHRYLNDTMNYDLREWLGNGQTMQYLYQAEIVIQRLVERYEPLSDQEWESIDLLSSSQYPDSTWYRRHRSSKLFIHERIKPEKKIGEVNEMSIENKVEVSEERKQRIRARIDQLRNQKEKKIQHNVTI